MRRGMHMSTHYIFMRLMPSEDDLPAGFWLRVTSRAVAPRSISQPLGLTQVDCLPGVVGRGYPELGLRQYAHIILIVSVCVCVCVCVCVYVYVYVHNV